MKFHALMKTDSPYELTEFVKILYLVLSNRNIVANENRGRIFNHHPNTFWRKTHRNLKREHPHDISQNIAAKSVKNRFYKIESGRDSEFLS